MIIVLALYILSVFAAFGSLLYAFCKNPRWGYGSYARHKTNGDALLAVIGAFVPLFNIFMSVAVLDQENCFTWFKGFWDRPFRED